MSSMARSDPENIHLNGRPSFPARSPRRNRRELGISTVRVRRITRRKRGLRYVASTCSTLLIHIPDQHDTAARAIVLIVPHLIGRTMGQANAAMDAGPNDVVRQRDIRVGESGLRNTGLHVMLLRCRPAAPSLPALRMPFGSNVCRTRSPSSWRAFGCG